MSIYDIVYDLKETRDGEESPYGRGAIYGDQLQTLIDDLEEAHKNFNTWSAEYAALKVESGKIKKELDALKEELAEAFIDGGEVKTSQGKRFTHPGEIVLFCSAGGPHFPAMVMEVCGYPVGKVGLRVFDRYGKDMFKYALYREEGEGRTYSDTWRFID